MLVALQPHRVRLVSLATQKFVSDILNDAFQHCKLRGAGQSSKKGSKVGEGMGEECVNGV